MKLHVITVAYHRAIPLRGLIDSFILQTCKDWQMTVIHDGPAPDDVKETIALYKNDPRVTFIDTDREVANWGWANRKMMLQLLVGDPGDFVLLENDDNYHPPRLIEFLFNAVKPGTGMIYYDMLHSHCDYDMFYTQIKEGVIDIAAFVVRLDVAQKTGFNNTHYSADGAYAEDCLKTCEEMGLKAVKINKCLLIHN